MKKNFLSVFTSPFWEPKKFDELSDEQQKKRAAMALNLCTTSISNIIACGDIEAMEREYNAILNNINLQRIIKDEALLTTMTKILDTITFFMLQEKDRKRLEQRHNQRMNSLLWESISSAGGLFVVGGNPWTVAAVAAIQAGSMYVGYQNKKRDAQIQFDDELWKLERSAIEQLHALRASLFETAWRLSDTYKFKDEWRLSVRQIDWYNEMRSETNDVIRYKKMEQYQDDFEAYPYYWYELGVAAQNIYEEKQKIAEEKEKCDKWLSNAEAHLSKFLALDQGMGLLRQDVIGADARLRHISILAKQKNSWVEAVRKDSIFLSTVKKLAVDDSELLLKAALVYASAYQELCQKEKLSELSDSEKENKTSFAKQAITFFEMLVMRENNLPISSIFLSLLYLNEKMENEYNELEEFAKHQSNAQFILVPKEVNSEERDQKLKDAWAEMFRKRCIPLIELFAKDYDTVLKVVHPNIYNTELIQQYENLFAWTQKIFENGQGKIKQECFDFWEPIKLHLNDNFFFAEKTLGLNYEELSKLAHSINNLTYTKIAQISDEIVYIKTNRNKSDWCMFLLNEIIDWQNSIRKEYSEGMKKIIEDNPKSKNNKDLNPGDINPDNINVLLSFHLDSIIYRRQLIGYESLESAASNVHVFFANDSEKEFCDGCEIPWEKFDAAKVDFFIDNQYSYTITCSEIDDQDYEMLLKILRARYSDNNTSWRNNTELFSEIASLLKQAKAKLFGQADYEITFSKEQVVVNYTKQKSDESIRDVNKLCPEAVKREIKRLEKITRKTDDDTKRYQELLKRYVSDKIKDILKIKDLNQRNESLKNLNKEINRKDIDPNTKENLNSIIQNAEKNPCIESPKNSQLPE